MSENSENKIRLILADDHEVVREGLKKLISVDKSFEILDVADNGAAAVNLVNKLEPDIALLDILMPKIDGIHAASIIKASNPEVKVVIFTAYEDSDHLEKALKAGADGYITKEAGAKDLIESLKRVYRGGRVFSNSIIDLLEKRFVSYQNIDNSPIELTHREQEVLNHVALGKTSAEISGELFISERTVQTHRSNVMQKLGLKSASSLIRYAILKYGDDSSKSMNFSKKI